MAYKLIETPIGDFEFDANYTPQFWGFGARIQGGNSDYLGIAFRIELILGPLSFEFIYSTDGNWRP